MYVIGLTGNIGTGKSTVLQLLRELGSEVIDADRVAHEVVVPYSAVWHAIRQRFGETVMLCDGQLDRERLGQLVFADPAALRDLETIVHPAVLVGIKERLIALRGRGAAAVTIEAIKLIEGKVHLLCDAVWVVICTPEQQFARLTAARGWSADKARQRMAAQAPILARLAAAGVTADVIVDNSGSRESAQEQVCREYYKVVSARRVTTKLNDA